MRALAIKYSDLGDHTKALEYVARMETLQDTVLPEGDNNRKLEIMLAKVDILLKKFTLGNEEDFVEPVEIAKKAYEMSKRLYGEKSFPSN